MSSLPVFLIFQPIHLSFMGIKLIPKSFLGHFKWKHVNFFSDCLSLMCINTTNFHVLILCFTSGLAASFVSLNKCRVLFCFYGISGFSKYKIMNPVVCKQRPFGVVLDNLWVLCCSRLIVLSRLSVEYRGESRHLYLGPDIRGKLNIITYWLFLFY